jgi:Tfp pilus assembly protein PilN
VINLLPPDVKENYAYARRNTRLLHWTVAFSFAIVGLAVLSVGGILYLNQTAKSYDKQVAGQQASLQNQDQAGTVKQVTDISNNLKLSLQVLSKQVLYSQLLKQLATIIPNNTALSSLNISQVQGALDITASAADYASATQLQVNLADPANKIFSKADIVNISCASVGSGDSAAAKKYPCTVTVRALFAPDNPYLFSGNGKVKAN